MAGLPSLVFDILNAGYILLGIAVAFLANRLYGSKPLGLWGDVVFAFLGMAAFTFFYKDRFELLLFELNDHYPQYFAMAYMPIVAFISVGFIRSLLPLVPGRFTQPAMAQPAMAMSGGPADTAAALLSVSPDASGAPSVPNVSTAATIPSVPMPAASRKTDSTFGRWTKIGLGVVLLVVVVLGWIGKYATRDDLPACGSQNVRDTLADIYKPLNVTIKRYGDFTTRSTEKDSITCTAGITSTADDSADVDYTITRSTGGDYQVKITSVHNK
jgi:hypothetical protein